MKKPAFSPLQKIVVGLFIFFIGGCFTPRNMEMVQETSSLISDSGNIFLQAPFKNCHAATLTPSGNDTLLYAWFGGDHEGAKNVAIWAAFRNTATNNFSEPFLLATGIDSAGNSQPCWNPVLFTPGNGEIWLDYKVGPNPRKWWAERKISVDDGKTWSVAKRLPAPFLGPIKNKPIQLNSGKILYPSSTESLDEKIWQIHLEISDANGENWQYVPIDNDTFGVIQPTILQHNNGRLQMLCRSRQNAIVQTWSVDGGSTWSPLSKLNVLNPNSGVDAVSLKSGWHLLVYNPMPSGKEWWLGRSVLKLAVSKNGINWTDVGTLENKPSGEFSYPAMIVDNKGMIRIAYTYNRTHIKFVDISEKQLLLLIRKKIYAKK